MWRIKQIFDGEYGCEERMPGEDTKYLVVLEDEAGNRRELMCPESWLEERHLEEGSEWTDGEPEN